MSFGGFGGFGSNTNQSTGFGGFGSTSNNNTTSGFGFNAKTSSIFGFNSASSNVFGGNSNHTSSPFGSGGGFTNNTNKTTFGSTPFGGSSTGGGLFGGASTGSAFGGGFGSNNNTTSAFGGNSNAGSSLFGQNKPTGFGSTATSGGLFGGGNTSGGFGPNTATTSAFGSSPSGFGAGNNNPPPNNGTASTPFQAFSEKDGTSATATQQYQTISFQSPYQNYALEELRLVDYNQGRRYGNQNGQAGAFGQSTGFGGFGSNNNTTSSASTGFGSTNTGSSLFSGTTANNSTFGSNAGSGFGANNNTSGGLFGQNKPATSGLFGSTNTNTASTTGGLFGNTNNNTTGGFGTSTGFGASTTNSGGLFGQNKPATGGLFGNSGATTNPSTGFGATNSNAFGQSTTGGGGLFGQNNSQPAANTGFGANTTANTGGGLFGGSSGGFSANNNNQASGQPSGGLFGGFGQNTQNTQPKTGGLFGSAPTAATGGGLFGQNTQAQPSQTGGIFGSSTTNANAGGLFGAKPATTGTSLFGGSASNTTTGGGLFGNLNTQNNQANAGSLFGAQNNAPKPGGLFGAINTASSGLFGTSVQNNQSALGGSLFQSTNQGQQQQQNTNSLFGASGSSLLNTSMATNPYGNDALFAGLATPTQSPGPIATPLSSSQKNKKSAILPQHKLNPSASTRLLTPQSKRTGYGFTYSTYGTPASSSSHSSPGGFGGSLFASGSLSRSLGKSLSTTNLRNSFTPETSILSPGAFSTTGRNFGNGSLKKLNVNRSINTRIPLFEEPSQKRVSFAGGEMQNCNTNGTTNGETALVVRRDEGDALPKAINEKGGDATPRASAQQVNGNKLAYTSEDHALTPKSSSAVNIQPGQDPVAGDYWSRPAVEQLKRMSKQDRKSISNFIVGRHNIGQINFNHGKPVDLSEVDLDKLFGDIVQLNPRNATVYGETCTCLPKPPLGTALNQPSEILLGNSWPRHKGGKKDTKHLERLKRVAGTTFIKYNQTNGEWTFSVPHFSSYGLDYDDYSEGEDDSSELSDVPDTPSQMQHRSGQTTGTPQEDSFVSPTQSQSSPDDTFDFKKGMLSRAGVPGGFDDDDVEDLAVGDEQMGENPSGQSFLGQRSVGLLDGQMDADYESESELGSDQSMADSLSAPIPTTELPNANEDVFRGSLKPKSILKASQVLRPGPGTPSRVHAVFDDDWHDQLQRTISPTKHDRHTLRESQGNVLREQDSNSRLLQSVGGKQMTTAMDLMDSLFGNSEKQKAYKRGGHGIELPYSKRPKTASDLEQLADSDKDFHSCNKPQFSHANILVYPRKVSVRPNDGLFPTAQDPLLGATKDICFAKMPQFAQNVPETMSLQKERTKATSNDGIPVAILATDPTSINFSDLAKAAAIDTPEGLQEQHAWQLLSLLFDAPKENSACLQHTNKELAKKERLCEYWKRLVWQDAQKHSEQADSPEERAIAQLSCNNVADACHALLEGLDLRLATMVAQIGGDATMRQGMVTQIEEWRRLDILSEMQDTHRALYELLSGNCAQSEGKPGPGRENKASTFNISSRFALDWRRAFGLRLWYGIMADEPIEMAVAQFADAINYGKEDAKPIPWFVQEDRDMGWTDPQAEHREDLLWGILKLYAASQMDLAANIEDVLAPENVSGHPLNARLSFQLFQLFKSRRDDDGELEERKIGMPTVRGHGDGDHRSSFLSSVFGGDAEQQADRPLTELGDKLTLTYAASLHTSQNWPTAAWVYMHLSNSSMREHFLKELLNQFSSTYALDQSDEIYIYLTSTLQIPHTWLHAAAALDAKSRGDSLRQATHLILAQELDEAHSVLCRKVGPVAVISRDYDPLREIIDGFLLSPPGSPMEVDTGKRGRPTKNTRSHPVHGWSSGGQIYFDYIELVDLTTQRPGARLDDEPNRRLAEVLSSLQGALEAKGWDGLRRCGIEERVALREIAGVVAEMVGAGVGRTHAGAQGMPGKGVKTGKGAADVLKLPMTEDVVLTHAWELSARYYRGVMAGGK